MIEKLHWSVLRPLLSVDLLTIQAFVELILASAIKPRKPDIIRDRLKIPRFITHVRSSHNAFRIAIENSHIEIVVLLLSKTSDPNVAFPYSPQPISYIL